MKTDAGIPFLTRNALRQGIFLKEKFLKRKCFWIETCFFKHENFGHPLSALYSVVLFNVFPIRVFRCKTTKTKTDCFPKL